MPDPHPQTTIRLQAAERTIDYALTQTVLPLDTHLALASAQWHLRRDLAQLQPDPQLYPPRP